ncbi:MAG: restriction endonuclease subunit S [Candidatus Pacebacteria bacterium]|nr:restriction endonuclease subunit S [Candidatus Paceibacterota bacterium]
MKINWQIKKLNEVCNIDYGTRVVRSRIIPGDFYVYGGGGKTFTLNEYNREDCTIVSRFAMSRNCVRKVLGKFFLNDSGLSISTKDGNILSQDFLDKFLFASEDLIYSLGRGQAQRNLHIDAFRGIEIPLPPLKTQKEIVAKLDRKMEKIKEARRLREEAIASTEKILSQTLREIFREERKRSSIVNLEEVATLVRGPFGGSLKKEIFVPKGDAVWEQGNVIDNDLENFRYFIAPEKFVEMRRFSVSSGDILMSCSGTIGKLIIIPNKFRKGIINQALLKISPNKKILGEYLKYALKDYLFGNTDHVKGMAIKNIAAVKELKKIQLPLPFLVEQKKIVAKLDALSEKVRQAVELQKSQLEDLKKLEKAYLREAFNGELI